MAEYAKRRFVRIKHQKTPIRKPRRQ